MDSSYKSTKIKQCSLTWKLFFNKLAGKRKQALIQTSFFFLFLNIFIFAKLIFIAFLYNMKSASQNLYFIALIPPSEIREHVMLLKNEMKDSYGAAHALKSPAHITLVMPFKRQEAEENLLFRSLKNFATEIQAFPIQLEDFDAFPPRVIFIKVLNHQPLIEFRQKLVQKLKTESGFTQEEIGSRFHPHMTIATRDLPEEQFVLANREFLKRKFNAGWTADSISLLKHQGERWEIFKDFGFRTDAERS